MKKKVCVDLPNSILSQRRKNYQSCFNKNSLYDKRYKLGILGDESLRTIESEIHDYFTSLEKNEDFSGSVLISKDEKVWFNRAYNFANREHQVKNTPETKFRIGSITKQFTAMAIMILQEHGQLDVADHVSKFIPSYKYGDHIKLHHLLTHSSGIPNITQLPDIKTLMKQPTTTEQIVRLITDLEPQFDPNSKFQYSNSGYILLAYIIEKTTGLTYEEFLSNQIFSPLGMKNSGCDNHKAIIPNRAQGYEYDNGIVNAEYIDMSFPMGGGNLYSTTEDLFKWDQSLYTERLVTRESLETIFTPHRFGYGYGWFIDVDQDRRKLFHGGGIVGFKNEIIRYVDDRITIILLNNLSTTNVEQIRNNLTTILFQKH
ncbi:beta-lactamase family protein [Paenibacillus barcinonensis]|uniref:serine hydrolase domain-containing protein n=1 Tax=Paenibacillus barcinonensis TaxID=198119 RepID=UPI001C123348|nr:serine hydrolase domain-containing protein [Paenibacillus barcinonensis]MBU5354705.1 beta-lactamase family protein [Paenibacillus barcinonensis]